MKTQPAILLASLLIGTNAFNRQPVCIAVPEANTQHLASHQQDTTFEPTTRKKLVKTELSEVFVFDKNQLVHTVKNPFGNKAALSFTLPTPQTSDNKTSTVVAWACWVGVNEAANQAWLQNKEALDKLPKEGPYTTPLGAYAAGAVSDLAVPTTGEDVYYAITNAANQKLFAAGQRFRLFDQGKGRAGYKKFTDPALCQGTYFVCLSNDNVLIPISVNIKVVAIVETKYYED